MKWKQDNGARENERTVERFPASIFLNILLMVNSQFILNAIFDFKP
jgi:hypothetical protein